MKRKPLVQLDRVLRDDQLAHLAERAISEGLAEANRREQQCGEGKRPRTARAPGRVSTILEDLGMTLPVAAANLVKEEKDAQNIQKKRLPTSVPIKRRVTSKKMK